MTPRINNFKKHSICVFWWMATWYINVLHLLLYIFFHFFMMQSNEPQCLRMKHTGNSFWEQIIILLDVWVHFRQQSVPSSPPPSCLEGNHVCYVHHLQPHWQVQGQYYLSKHGVYLKLKYSPGTLGDFWNQPKTDIPFLDMFVNLLS